MGKVLSKMTQPVPLDCYIFSSVWEHQFLSCFSSLFWSSAYVLDAVQYWYERLILCRYFIFYLNVWQFENGSNFESALSRFFSFWNSISVSYFKGDVCFPDKVVSWSLKPPSTLSVFSEICKDGLILWLRLRTSYWVWDRTHCETFGNKQSVFYQNINCSATVAHRDLKGWFQDF